MEWQPIETVPKYEFDQEKWFVSGPYYLLWAGRVAIGCFSYTQKGKGRWQDNYGNIKPTHLMPLPTKPHED